MMKRIHILQPPADPRVMARFLVNSLLVSHGVRRESVAVIGTPRFWLEVPGDRVRQLRPDSDTAEGWVRAAMRKPGSLGARIIEKPRVRGGPCIIVEKSSRPQGILIEPQLPGDTEREAVYIVYKQQGSSLVLECRAACVVALPLPLWLAPATVNVEMDRVEAGLEPLVINCLPRVLA